MGRRSAVSVKVENQLMRYSAPEPFGQDEVVDQLGGKRSGKYVILALKNPRATLLVDAEGRLTVHGTNRGEIARSAAREMSLRLGRSDEGITAERGPLIATFDYGDPLRIDKVQEFYPEFEMDSRLEALRIDDSNHGMELLFFSNGRGVALGARSKNLVKMAASHWGSRFDAESLFVDVLVKDEKPEMEEVEEQIVEEAIDIDSDDS